MYKLKNNTQSAQSAWSAQYAVCSLQSAWSAFQHDCKETE